MVKPSAHHALPVGGMIEEFRIVRVLGSGGFGIVYQCDNTYLPETVAIKEFLPPELACRMPDGQVLPLSAETEESFSWARGRFLQEAKTLWELARPNRHPNIVRVTRYCEANGTAYMFMEFEQGRPLSAILEAQKKLTPDELDGLFFPLLDGLERVHAAGVVHRDIKPANILIRADGTPVLIDFGAARHLVAGVERSIVAAYTPVYAALEQYLEIGEQGPWTDIYSFGATLYQAVTGRKPMNASERLYGATQVPAAEECEGLYPQAILVGIDKALALRPEDRPQDVAEWRRIMREAEGAPPGSERTVFMPTAGPDEPTRLVPGPEDQAEAAPQPVGPQEPDAGEVATHRSRTWLGAVIGVALLLSIGAALYFREALFPMFRPVTEKPVATEPEPEVEAEVVTAEQAPAHPDEESVPPVEKDAGVTESAVTEPEGPASQVTREEDRAPVVQEPVSPGSRFSDDLEGGGAGPVMVWLPAGEFQMGSPSGEAGRNPDERLHTGAIPQPFAVSETEITLGQFRSFVKDTGYRTEVDRQSTCLRPNESWEQLVPDMLLSWESPGYDVTDQSPVTCVSWNDAEAYVEWLTAKSGHQYRLPTEMEWEYAARAGTPASRFWGDDPITGCKLANTAECEDDYTYPAPAGVYPPNPFGLRDMLGNVAEWTCSDYGKGYGGAEERCSQGASASARVFRGGSWLDAPALVRSAARDGAPANLGLNTVGFRVVRLPEVSTGSAGADVAGKR